MLSLALTGGIGAGKSTVSAELASLGARIIDADVISREIVQPGMPAYNDIVEEFSSDVLAPDGQIDRDYLGHQVFTDSFKRARLNEITHPRIFERSGELADEYLAADPQAIVVNDIALLAGTPRAFRAQANVVVVAPKSERLERLVGQRGMMLRAATNRIAAQPDDDVRVAIADAVIDNGGAPADLLEYVGWLWENWVVPLEANLRGAGVHGLEAADAPRRVQFTDLGRRAASRLLYNGVLATVDGQVLTAHREPSADEQTRAGFLDGVTCDPRAPYSLTW